MTPSGGLIQDIISTDRVRIGELRLFKHTESAGLDVSAYTFSWILYRERGGKALLIVLTAAMTVDNDQATNDRVTIPVYFDPDVIPVDARGKLFYQLTKTNNGDNAMLAEGELDLRD